ncbi:MAG: hypothetical protein ABW185_04645 [Sedimenticola sp.]
MTDFANRLFKAHYIPKQEVSIDESLVATKGRTCMTQYIPSKSAKRGVKFWVLAESGTGYIMDMKCYLGKIFSPVQQGTLQGTSVVMDMLQRCDLLRKSYHVVCDNFFASIDLAKKLLQNGTYMTGTIRKTRPMPPSIKLADVAPGTARYMRQGKMLMAAYRTDRPGRKPVRLLSTLCHADTNQGKPAIVKTYNKHMGGVDEADMLLSFYDGKRKSIKVWKKMALHIFQRMLLNAYILYTKHTSDQKKKSRIRFNQDVIDGLAREHLPAHRPIAAARRGGAELQLIHNPGTYTCFKTFNSCNKRCLLYAVLTGVYIRTT